MIEIIPAIDIIGGRCVRLTQGDYGRTTVYDASPEEMVRRYADAGVERIHVVDLDGAKAGAPQNLPVLRRLASLGLAKIELGGGIKDTHSLEAVLDAGADYAIAGSIAVRSPATFAEWLRAYGGDRIILGADVREGRIAVSGWLEESDCGADDLVERFIPSGLTQAIVTDISRDGMLKGPNTGLYTALADRFPNVAFTVSGGISDISDIMELDRLGLPRVIVGKAIYEGRITLEQLKQLNKLT